MFPDVFRVARLLLRPITQTDGGRIGDRQALRILPETQDGQATLPVPEICAVTLDELFADEP